MKPYPQIPTHVDQPDDVPLAYRRDRFIANAPEHIPPIPGLEQVKYLLHTYEHGEAQQARDQERFVWPNLAGTQYTYSNSE
jgi:hypothetical protein